MQIREVMTPNVEVIHPTMPLQEAAQRMKDLDVGSLPVCDGERLLGMITDRDITIRATARGHNPMTTQVSDIMTPKVVYCFEEDDVQQAANIMEENQIRRLPILNASKRLVGIVSLGDLAIGTQDEQLAGEALTEISQPATPYRQV